MFSGIITHTGEVTDASRSSISIRARRDVLEKLARGASIAVDGACLTVVKKDAKSFVADIMEETMRRTTLSKLRRGAKVNLELPMTAATFLSGHIVQGHVDGVAKVKEIRKKDASFIISLEAPAEISRYLVNKGSVAINGVSLTIIEVRGQTFSVGIIPHTWKATTFGTLKAGDLVNIETDILAKYVAKLIRTKKS
ncbi:MAG: Riboflavin synthase, alpha subunit [Parcubacteria group bacterium GW2011_GWA2_51_10]|nr:MAG: Riboflavin synthase, alpha subunit [Parcubacteria group bacterium GW2011_GWA2_51_10]